MWLTANEPRLWILVDLTLNLNLTLTLTLNLILTLDLTLDPNLTLNLNLNLRRYKFWAIHIVNAPYFIFTTINGPLLFYVMAHPEEVKSR